MSGTEQQQKTETTGAEMTAPRAITIVSTRGEKVKIPFEGGTWKDLKQILEKGGKCFDDNMELTKKFDGYSLNQMKCVESSRRSTLEHPDAVVPDGNFNLFLMPIKSKSGSDMSRADVNSKIKDLIERDGDKAREHFNSGKNYTNKATSVLVELLEGYAPGTKKKVSANKAEAISQVVTSVKAAKLQGNKDEILSQLSDLSTDEKLDLVIQLLLGVKADNSGAETLMADVLDTVAEESPEVKEQREKEEKEKQERENQERIKREKKQKEEKELDDEMKNMMGGFSDVQR